MLLYVDFADRIIDADAHIHAQHEHLRNTQTVDFKIYESTHVSRCRWSPNTRRALLNH